MSRMEDLGALVRAWPVETVVAGITDPQGTLGVAGDPDRLMRIASVGKLFAGMAALIAIEEGSLELDEPAGPEGSTVRHLLAHASGLAFDQDRSIAPPGKRRIYSNAGIERFVAHLESKTGMSFDDYFRIGVREPLEMRATELRGSPAHAGWSTVSDLLAFSRELTQSTLVSAETLADATRPHFPKLAGVLPDLGRFDPNPWGLTFEIRGDKQPHWTGTRNSPRTFGHFGGSGSFLWVDPDVGLAAVAITDREFGPWALEAWPIFSDEVLETYAPKRP
jgi:CubicO group peptidase (beta-lactamase class C family)